MDIQRRVGGVARKYHQQGVAVGRGLRCHPGADGAAGAGAVVDDHGLAELGADTVADHPRQQIGDAADPGRHDDLDGVIGIILRHRGGVACQPKRRGQDYLFEHSESLLPLGFLLCRVGYRSPCRNTRTRNTWQRGNRRHRKEIAMPYAPAQDATRLYYEEAGSGTPILFVHEFAADYASWEPQMRYFSRGHRCIAYSARGYTPSEVPAGNTFTYENFRDDALAVLDHLKIDRAHLVGLSMGAYSSLQVGLNNPRSRDLADSGRRRHRLGAGADGRISQQRAAQCAGFRNARLGGGGKSLRQVAEPDSIQDQGPRAVLRNSLRPWDVTMRGARRTPSAAFSTAVPRSTTLRPRCSA